MWITDRRFCTRPIPEGWAEAEVCFIVREHTHHPRVMDRGAWQDGGQVEIGTVRQQAVTLDGHATSWRRIELALDVPTQAGDTTIRTWSNLPPRLHIASTQKRATVGNEE